MNHRKRQFLLTRPSRDVTEGITENAKLATISTHTPLAGRDYLVSAFTRNCIRFLLTRPSRDVTPSGCLCWPHHSISTHTPLAGRDETGLGECLKLVISTHTPLAGRDPA